MSRARARSLFHCSAPGSQCPFSGTSTWPNQPAVLPHLPALRRLNFGVAHGSGGIFSANGRVNGISAGPIKTLAAAGIAGFRKMLSHVAGHSPLRRNVTIEDVGNTAAFLCSDLAAGITGEVIYVDGGYSSVGMSFGEGE